MKIFQLSDYFRLLLPKLTFATIVIRRFLKILFRKNKTITLIRLEYSHKYLFDTSYLVVKYRFKNALWYNFGRIKNTTEKELIVFNLQNVHSSQIRLVVRGFFRSKAFLIPIHKQNAIESKTFTASIINLNRQMNFTNPFVASISAPSVNIPSIRINAVEKTIYQQPYNQSDFI
jgi:hypothetical protein